MVRKWLNIPTSNSDYSTVSDFGYNSDSKQEFCDGPKESRFKNDKPDQLQVDANVPRFAISRWPNLKALPQFQCMIDQKLSSQVHEIVGRINERFGTLTAVSIRHLVRPCALKQMDF